MRNILMILALALSSCARVAIEPKPKVAPVAKAEQPKPDPLDAARRPGQMLEIGLKAFDEKNYKYSMKAFRKAINSHRLNDAGMAMSYWHLFMAATQIKVDGLNDLLGFIVASEDILDSRTKYAIDEANGTDFVARFDLETKLRHARNILEGAWECKKQGAACEVD